MTIEQFDDIITPQGLAEDIGRFRSLCLSRDVRIEDGTFLSVVLDESRRWIDAAKDIGVPDWDMLSQDRGVEIADDILIACQISRCSNALAERSVTGLTERLAAIAAHPLNDPIRQQQFVDECYEVDTACDLLRYGEKVSFIKRRQKSSRTIKRVEFLIRHKWPGECKRPRSLANVKKNVKLASAKIAERRIPGLVFISLQGILRGTEAYEAAEDVSQYVQKLERRFRANREAIGKAVLKGLKATTAVGCIMHHSELVRYTQQDTVGRPTTRYFLTADGQWIRQGILPAALERLGASAG